MELYITYRPYMYIGLCIYSGITYYYIEDKLLTANILTIYTLIDTIVNPVIINNYDYLFHHFLLLLSYVSFYYYDYRDFIHITINPALSFQISSIFLSLDILFTRYNINKKIKYVNNIFFITTFIYYRIYRYYYDTLIHPDLFIFLNKYNKCIGLIIYSFFILNMYWLCLIIKKVNRMLKFIK